MTAECRVSRESLRLTAPGPPHTAPSPTDSRHGNCRLCRLSRRSPFAAAGRSEPRGLQPTLPEPADGNPGKSLILQRIDPRLSVGDSSASRKRGSAIVAHGATGFADDQVHIVEVATLSRRSPFRRWL